MLVACVTYYCNAFDSLWVKSTRAGGFKEDLITAGPSYLLFTSQCNINIHSECTGRAQHNSATAAPACPYKANTCPLDLVVENNSWASTNESLLANGAELSGCGVLA